MSPDPDDFPIVGTEASIGVAITRLVRGDLRPPKFGVPRWPRRVLRATMPETAIDKNRHSWTHKSYVCNPAWPGQHGNLEPIPQPHCKELTPQCRLGRSILLTDSLHPSPRLRRRWRDLIVCGHAAPLSFCRWQRNTADVSDDALADGAPKLYGYRVANEATQNLELNLIPLRHKGVVAREPLKDGTLAK